MYVREEGEIIDEDDHASIGSVNMVQINDESKEEQSKEKELVEVCQTYLTYQRRPRNPPVQDPQMSEVSHEGE